MAPSTCDLCVAPEIYHGQSNQTTNFSVNIHFTGGWRENRRIACVVSRAKRDGWRACDSRAGEKGILNISELHRVLCAGCVLRWLRRP